MSWLCEYSKFCPCFTRTISLQSFIIYLISTLYDVLLTFSALEGTVFPSQSRLVSGHCALSSCSASLHSIMEPDLPLFFLLQGQFLLPDVPIISDIENEIRNQFGPQILACAGIYVSETLYADSHPQLTIHTNLVKHGIPTISSIKHPIHFQTSTSQRSLTHHSAEEIRCVQIPPYLAR
ncbi:hypothetical protein CPB84DRAFT_220576 [Gymnopilus junonius]|uniref:Uncharacterized protein n=1 Tax=Gymnopilus junonius TaxID=109634 RepID=A0A9P5TJ30_GYMJU|nr:hypothetical protein CPB84DRAFT_220576 [Gymnopilus junonius]